MPNYNSIEHLTNEATRKKCKISEIVLEDTAKEMGISKEMVIKQMVSSLTVMKEATINGLKKDTKSLSGLTGGAAYLMKNYVDNKKNFSGSFIGQIIYSALAVSEINACMGRIVAAPTAGSCGIIPACLLTLQKEKNFSDEEIAMALINASAVGIVIAKNASIAGAEGGCQAECGSASAMAASGMVELLGGTPKMCDYAISQAIKSQMGLVCDPVAGLVEEPCIIRNVSSAVIAVSSTEMTLAGIKSIIPADEVIKAMDQVGRSLPPALRETAGGGIATSDTAKRLEKEILKKL